MGSTTQPRTGKSWKRTANSRENDAATFTSGDPPRRLEATEQLRVEYPAWLVEPAGPGDHPLIYQLLRTVFHGPTESEFHAQLDHPRYKPPQRLLVRHNRIPAAHARVCPREIKFGPLRLPAIWLADLATLPEFRGQGFASSLLAACEQEAARQEAEVMMLRTSAVEFYLRRGWVVCGRHSYSVAPPRNILAALNALPSQRRLPLFDPEGDDNAAAGLRVRLWRHVEQDQLMQLYDDATTDSYGPLHRGDAYWRWLLSRRGYDRIHVAVENATSKGGAEGPERIVGYSVMLRGRVVELAAEDDRDDVRRVLLARACSDAIEHDEHTVRYDAPPGDAWHRLLGDAGGTVCHREVDAGHVFMAKLVSPEAFVRSLAPLLLERARAAGLPRPFELGVQIDGRRSTLSVTRRTVRLEPGRMGRSYLTCRTSEWMQLLLGHLDAASALSEQRIAASTRAAAESAAVLFPQLPFWHPPLDDLPA